VSVLRNLERKIGGLFEGVFTRTFRSGVQPVELARKLAKEMDDNKTISIHRVYVPNEYTVYLSPPDREQFTGYEAKMREELAEYLLEHARREGYTLTTRPLVLLESEPDLAVGEFGIAVSITDGEQPLSPPPDAVPDMPLPEARPAEGTMVYAPPAPEPEPAPPEPPRAAPARAGLRLSDGDRPLPPDGVVVGRSSACDLVVDDPNVSRRHVEIRPDGDGWTALDLGSTNGTELNGRRIERARLEDGDEITVGTTRITFARDLG
jgi:Protein of unknown function (DUF3662)/FHA domain